jgi:adenylate kinase family enzyme
VEFLKKYLISKRFLFQLKDGESSMREELVKLVDLEKNTDKKWMKKNCFKSFKNSANFIFFKTSRSVEQLQELVSVNDGLKQKEQDYKKNCKVSDKSKLC